MPCWDYLDSNGAGVVCTTLRRANREKHGRVRRLVGLDRILVNDVGQCTGKLECYIDDVEAMPYLSRAQAVKPRAWEMPRRSS